MKTATNMTETREEQQARELAEIGRRAFESIAEMVAKLEAFEKDDDGDDPDHEACDAAREEIEQDPLSLQVRSGWYSPGEEPGAPEEFQILLATGGPAVRIVGELNQYGEPTHARLQTQDWGTPWTEYLAADRDVLLTYCGVFYFGGGR